MKYLFTFFFVISFYSLLNATVINVPGDSLFTIQAGMDSASSSDTVLVQPGTYVESINYHGKAITVGSLFLTTGDTSYILSTIIDGNSAGSVVTFNSSEDSSSILNGFTVQNGAASFGGGINCMVSDPKIKNLIIKNNTAYVNGGGINCTSGNPIIKNVNIANNTAYLDGGGIYIEYSQTSLENMTIENNSADNGGGIYLNYVHIGINIKNTNILNNYSNFNGGAIYAEHANILLERVIIADNTAGNEGGGIYCDDAVIPLNIVNCTLYGNTGGAIYAHSDYNLVTIDNAIIWNNLPYQILRIGQTVYVSYSDIEGGWSGTGNININPQLINPSHGNFNLQSSSPCIDTGNPYWLDPDGTRLDMGALYFHQHPGPVWYVSTTGSDIIGDGSQLNPFASIQLGIKRSKVGGTVLVDTGLYQENINFIGKNIRVTSQYYNTQDTSYISSTIIDGDNSGNVVSFMSGEDSRAVLSGLTIMNGDSLVGGGIYCQNSGPILENNIIKNNHADSLGGGIYFLNSEINLFDNKICHNSADWGGGVYSIGNTRGVISGNTFYSDSASMNGGGLYLSSDSIEINNNIIQSNWGQETGGLYCVNSTVNNNTFCFNKNQSAASALSVNSADTIYNNIFYQNVGGTGAVYTIGALRYNNFYGNVDGDFYGTLPAGTGTISTVNTNGDSCDIFSNIFLDPLFADTAIFDFHLTQNSPCIDAGDPKSSADPDNTIQDIGAFYFHQSGYGTAIYAGSVSGVWNIAGSPYGIYGDIKVLANSSLTIEPGVTVIFHGHHKLIVNGVLQAIGTESDSIRFTAADTSVGWRGLRFKDNMTDICSLSFCRIEYGKATTGLLNTDGWGGGIFCFNSIPQISNCTIAYNYAELDGGGVFLFSDSSGTPFRISNCKFINNSCNDNYGGAGAFFQYDSVIIDDCIFENNQTTGDGGAIYFYPWLNNMYLSLNRSTFDNNSALSEGGGLYYRLIGSDRKLDINECSFINNQAVVAGGGLWINSFVFGTVNISNTKINNNRALDASAHGGGVYMQAATSTFHHNQIIGNQAHWGGGMYIIDYTVPILNCTFTANFADLGSAIFYDPNAAVDIKNSIFAFHSNSAIHNNGVVASVSFSDFYGNDQHFTSIIPPNFGQLTQINANGDSCDVYSNIFFDPLFADTTTCNLQLSWMNFPLPDSTKSPAIDAGDPGSPNDPDNTFADMGFIYFDQLIPSLYVNNDSLNFGEVEVGNQLDTTFTIYNQGFDTLIINQISNSLNVFTTNFNPGNNLILPGDSMLITVTFVPADSGFVDDTLTINNNAQLANLYLSGTGKIIVGLEEDDSFIPKVYALYPAFPNPFNPTTTIKYDLPKVSFVELKIFDILGKQVGDLISDQKSAGRYNYIFNGSNLASGLYFVQMQAEDFQAIQKILLVK